MSIFATQRRPHVIPRHNLYRSSSGTAARNLSHYGLYAICYVQISRKKTAQPVGLISPPRVTLCSSPEANSEVMLFKDS